jgi:hypothetical protein
MRYKDIQKIDMIYDENVDYGFVTNRDGCTGVGSVIRAESA